MSLRRTALATYLLSVVLTGITWHSRLTDVDLPVFRFEAETGRLRHALTHEASDASAGRYVEFGPGDESDSPSSVAVSLSTLKDGTYYLWARTLWMDACSNSLLVTQATGQSGRVGNDEVFGIWHWVRLASPIVVTPNSPVLQIVQSERNPVSIDALEFTRSSTYIPSDSGAAFATTFLRTDDSGWTYDPAPMFSTHATGGLSVDGSSVAAKMWRRRFQPSPVMTIATRAVLVGKSDSTLAYCFDDTVPELDDTTIVLATTGWYLTTKSTGVPEATAHQRALSHNIFDGMEHQLLMLLDQSSASLYVDGEAQGSLPMSGAPKQFGIMITRAKAILKECRVAPVVAPQFAANFYWSESALNENPGWRPIAGKWSRDLFRVGPLSLAVIGKGKSTTVCGEDWWTRYRARVSFLTLNDSSIGLLFGYRNERNFCAAILRQDPAGGAGSYLASFLTMRSGQLTTAATKPAQAQRGLWHVLELANSGSSVTLSVDHKPVLDAPLASGPGLVGLSSEAGREPKTLAYPVRDLGELGVPPGADWFNNLTLFGDNGESFLGLYFDYVDDQNHMLLAVDGGGRSDRTPPQVVISRTRAGAKTVLANQQLPVADDGAGYSSNDIYPACFNYHAGHLTIDAFDKRLLDASIGNFLGGRTCFAVTDLKDAYFDDMEVVPIEGPPLDHPKSYRFDVHLFASRDLAEWIPESGHWDISQMLDTFYRFFGVPEKEKRALVWNTRWLSLAHGTTLSASITPTLAPDQTSGLVWRMSDGRELTLSIGQGTLRGQTIEWKVSLLGLPQPRSAVLRRSTSEDQLRSFLLDPWRLQCTLDTTGIAVSVDGQPTFQESVPLGGSVKVGLLSEGRPFAASFFDDISIAGENP